MPRMTPGAGGDVDIASVAALFADRTRARVLVALSDGRALPASVLAAEAGVSAQATSAQLSKLMEAGFLQVQQAGRHRYYRLADGMITGVIEALAQLAPIQPVTSLRQSTHANALREARLCYDHVAGKLGVGLMQALLDNGALASTDGIADNRARDADMPSTRMSHHPYILGPHAAQIFPALGVPNEQLREQRSRRPLLRFCMDWSEQRHHLAGRLGALVCSALLDRQWVTRLPARRTLALTAQGERELAAVLGAQALSHSSVRPS